MNDAERHAAETAEAVAPPPAREQEEEPQRELRIAADAPERTRD
jgi:hypothetical protein